MGLNLIYKPKGMLALHFYAENLDFVALMYKLQWISVENRGKHTYWILTLICKHFYMYLNKTIYK